MTIIRQIEKRTRGLVEPAPRSAHASQLVPYSGALANPEYIEVYSEDPNLLFKGEIEPDRDPGATIMQGPVPKWHWRKTIAMPC